VSRETTYKEDLSESLDSVRRFIEDPQTIQTELVNLSGELARLEAIARCRIWVSAVPNTPAEDQLLSVEKASARLGVSQDHVYRKAARGEYPFVIRQGRRVLFSSLGLNEYIRNQARKRRA
jgi:excisionase family DNA binding protein